MNQEIKSVKVWTEKIIIPTYLPAAPEVNPMFLENRVYQGSSGKVYPLPFTDRVSETKNEREWTAVYLENEFLQVLILPEIGGRIHAIFDKINNYDLIYRQTVIKPALVGLAGSWISGGIEFNWAQHHRPATFLPVEFEIEESADGAKTVWLGDHEPMTRMKGMHGVCLRPDEALVEIKARVYNRTPLAQTFLWWANAAAKVHEGYQSFFPPDVSFVADHAKRAMSEYPFCKDFYYGVNYGERAEKGVPDEEIPRKFVPVYAEKDESKIRNLKSEIPEYAPNDLSWYANIPVPTSYMCVGSNEDFFGGYDHFADAGIVHVADHHIAPGKKQWTWGNHEFGYAWDANLSDDSAPYIELMAGVFTDNQPDFSFLAPFETKSWSQFFYGIGKIGVPIQANENAALSLKITKNIINIGVCVTCAYKNAEIIVNCGDKKIELKTNLTPAEPFVYEIKNDENFVETEIKISDAKGNNILFYAPQKNAKNEVPMAAIEPLLPSEIESVEELFLTGLHLEQYRHATRNAEDYWREAVKKDALDSRSNNALGLFHLRRGEFPIAENYFKNAIKRLTARNPNPADGAAFYNLGWCLRFQLDENPQAEIQNPKFDEAYAAFYKAAWNFAQSSPAFLALAEMDCARKHWKSALAHLENSLRLNAENLWARNLKVLIWRELEFDEKAENFLAETAKLDALDQTAKFLRGENLQCDWQTRLDIAHDFARAGFYVKAIDILTAENPPENSSLQTQNFGVAPLVYYTLGKFYKQLSNDEKALENFKIAAESSTDYCFPQRLEEIEILRAAMRENPTDANAPYYLGNLFYDKKRHAEAIELWEKSAALDPRFSIVWRNLGIGYFNVLKDAERAKTAYNQAFAANETDARILFERDQLWKRVGETPEKRLRELEKYFELVNRRDDLTIEICALYNQTDQPEKALRLLESRRFQPWEGGEGQTLAQFVRARLLLGGKALQHNDLQTAKKHFEAALNAPENLGEAKHLLANQSDIFYRLGVVENLSGNQKQAADYWRKASNFKGDFQAMSVRAFSEMTYYSALSMQKSGDAEKSKSLLKELLAYAENLEKTTAKIDYFATSLPTMLLFEDDIQARQKTDALFLQAQAHLGSGDFQKAETLLRQVLERDSNHAPAADLLKNDFEKIYEKVSN